MVEGALLVDAVDAKVDGGAQHAVEVAGVVAHWAVAGRLCKVVSSIIIKALSVYRLIS